MKFQFKARIYKTGINWAVNVPERITRQLEKEKGYIRIKGQINQFDFIQTLVPVKDAEHRLYVNGIMMKGGQTAVGKVARFSIEQNRTKLVKEYPMPPSFKKRLQEEKLTKDFNQLRPARIKDILKYLSFVKTEETRQKHIEKVILQLKNKEKDIRIP